MKNFFKFVTLFCLLFCQIESSIFALEKEVNKIEESQEKIGVGFVFSLPSNLSTELSFSPKISENNCKLRLSMMHDLSAVHETKKLILEDKVKLVILIGSCYSKLPEIGYGDLIYVDGYIQPKKRNLLQNVKEAGSNKFFKLHIKDVNLIDKVEKFLEKESEVLALSFNKHGFDMNSESKSKLISGLIVSGESVFISENYFNEFKKQYPSLVATDIEGSSVAKVCKKYNIPLLSIKMIFPELNVEESPSKSWISLHKEITEVFFKRFIEEISEYFSKNH